MDFLIIVSLFTVGIVCVLWMALKHHSPMRAGVGLLSAIFLVPATLINPSTPPPVSPLADAPSKVENIGDANFGDFYARYSAILGSPVSRGVEEDGTLKEWFRFGRLEYQPAVQASQPSAQAKRPDASAGSTVPMKSAAEGEGSPAQDGPLHPGYKTIRIASLGSDEYKRQAGASASAPRPAPIVSAYLQQMARDDFYVEPAVPGATGGLQDLGDAKFKSFYEKYRDIIGEPVGPVVVSKDTSGGGFVSQFFQYGRVELHPEAAVALHPSFPKLQMGLVGREYLEKLAGKEPTPRPQIDRLLQQWLLSKVTTDVDILYFYGNPITSPQSDPRTGLTRQYFERAVFEWKTGSDDPNAVTQVQAGREVFFAGFPEAVANYKNRDEAKQAFIAYFYGRPVGEPTVVADSAMMTQYFEKAQFEWPTGSSDPTQVRPVPLGEQIYSRRIEQPQTPPWFTSPFKMIFLTLSFVTLIVSLVLHVMLREGASVYARF